MQLMSGDQSGPVVELEGSLLSDIHIPFKVALILIPTKTHHYWCSWGAVFHKHWRFSSVLQLVMPLPAPEYLNVNYICESASRLLFLSMHWARSIPAFQTLWSVFLQNSCFQLCSCATTLNRLSSCFIVVKITTSTWWRPAGTNCLPWEWPSAPVSWMSVPF